MMDVNIEAVEIFFTTLLVVVVATVTWFAGFVVYKLYKK